MAENIGTKLLLVFLLSIQFNIMWPSDQLFEVPPSSFILASCNLVTQSYFIFCVLSVPHSAMLSALLARRNPSLRTRRTCAPWRTCTPRRRWIGSAPSNVMSRQRLYNRKIVSFSVVVTHFLPVTGVHYFIGRFGTFSSPVPSLTPPPLFCFWHNILCSQFNAIAKESRLFFQLYVLWCRLLWQRWIAPSGSISPRSRMLWRWPPKLRWVFISVGAT